MRRNRSSNDYANDYVVVRGTKMHASCVHEIDGVIRVDSGYANRLPLVPGKTDKSSYSPLEKEEGNSWEREVLKRAKYALKKNLDTPAVKVAKYCYGGDGPGDFDNRGGCLRVKVGDKTLKVEISSKCDLYGEDRKWAHSWYTPLDEVWSAEFMRWVENDRVSCVVLAAMTEVLASRHKDNNVWFDWMSELDRPFRKFYQRIAGHAPEFSGERIGW